MLLCPQDRDLIFYLNAEGAGERTRSITRRCLASLREHYPAAAVILVTDGDQDAAWTRLARRYAVRHVRGRRAGESPDPCWRVQRMLNLFVEQPTAFLIQLDAEQVVQRRLEQLPSGCCGFGALRWNSPVTGRPLGEPVLDGGCIGLTREAAEVLQNARLLMSHPFAAASTPVFDPPGKTSRELNSGYETHQVGAILSRALQTLGIECLSSPEIEGSASPDLSLRHETPAFSNLPQVGNRSGQRVEAMLDVLPGTVRVILKRALAAARGFTRRDDEAPTARTLPSQSTSSHLARRAA